MSNTNFSYDFIQQMQAHHVALQSPPVGNGSLNFPYSDPSDWSSENSFDTSIPYNQDGTIDVNALLEKLRKMLYYSSQGDQMDFNSMLDITSYLMNIGGVWSQLKAQGADGQVQQFLNLPVNGSGQTLIQLLAKNATDAIIYGTYYKNGGDQAATQQFADQFIAALQGISGNTSILNPILQAAENIGNPQALSQWMNNPDNQGINFDQFTFTSSLAWEGDFSMNDDTPSYMDGWRGLEIQDALGQADATKNPFLAYILIMYILMNENGDLQTQIGGRGSLMDTMKKALGDKALGLNSQWASGNFTPDSAKGFFQSLQNLFALCHDQRFASIMPQIKQAYDDLTSPSSDPKGGIQVTFIDPVTKKPVTENIGQLYQDINNPKSSYFGQWGLMAQGMNSLQPSTTPGVPTPSGFATLANDLGQITTSVTSASSAQGQIVQNEEGVNEKELAFITATANEVINAEKAITQNTGNAGN